MSKPDGWFMRRYDQRINPPEKDVTELIEEKSLLATSVQQNTTVLAQNAIDVVLPEPLMAFSRNHEIRPTVVFRSETMGEGNPVLGDQLMTEFLQALLAHPEPPQTMLFYNSAIHLTLDDSLALDAIRSLNARGAEVMICRTSLQMQAPGCQPAVGRIASLAELTDRMRQAQLLLWP